MPRLDENAANRVNEAEESSGIMDEGIYEMILTKVETASGDKGTYWKWTFKVPEDAPKYPKWNQWLNTSLSEASAWRLKEVFKAFGVTPDTDTDDLIGQRVRVEVGTTIIQKGPRTGEAGNQVKKVLPLSGDGNSAAEGTSGGLF